MPRFASTETVRAVVIGKACLRACSAQAAIDEAFDKPVLWRVEE